VLDLSDVSKSYGRVRALSGVGISLMAGEVVALLGDNGAGKSTLVKVISGTHRPDSGQILVRGEPVEFRNPRDARLRGISTVFQDLALVEVLDVARNIYLGREPTRALGFVRRTYIRRETRALFQSLKIGLPSPRTPVAMLSGGQRQGVAIARAVSQGGEVFVLDEPTAALGLRESGRVMELILGLKERGAAVLVVSHNIDQIFAVADRFHVLRLGRMVTQCAREETTKEELVSFITGAITNPSQRSNS
jgi:ABC-type sugar transport system ATPase subunit